MFVLLACAQPARRTEVRLTVPAVDTAAAQDMPGLHNVVTYAPGFVCGSVPDGEAGFRTLATMGIRTVITVDGAAPDVAEASKFGLRYVHLPIGYDGVPEPRALALAQAISSLPGPVYLHCHHGKHRSAAALGTAAVMAGLMTNEQAEARMQVSGTAADYTGLWQSTRKAQRLDPTRLKVDPSVFASVEQVKGITATMVNIDSAFDDLKALQKNQWTTPAAHPDLVPQSVAKRLHSLLDGLRSDADARKHPADFQGMLERAIGAAQALETAVDAGDAPAASQRFDAVSKSCKECHKVYRDR